MPLSAADLATLGDTPITIRSTAFPNVYLRMDGSGVTSQTANGGGTVNCQFSAGPAGPWERYKVRKQADGTFSFESAAFPNVYLRMNGSGVTSQTANGGGTVNCQFNANGGPYEKYKLNAQADGAFSFESAAFPNVYLRMNGSGVTSSTDHGGGTVNCQFNANGGVHEKFFLNMADQHLDFAMQHQQQTNWCWAAASVSITAFYDPPTAWTQCSLVNAELGRNDCCGAAGAGADCNKPWWYDRALRRVAHFNEYVAGALTAAQVGAEMAKSAPIGVATMWAGGGGHAVVVRGRFLLDAVEYLSVADPWYGDSDVSYDTFRNRYQNSGTWTQTHKTQR